MNVAVCAAAEDRLPNTSAKASRYVRKLKMVNRIQDRLRRRLIQRESGMFRRGQRNCCRHFGRDRKLARVEPLPTCQALPAAMWPSGVLHVTHGMGTVRTGD